MQDNRIGKKELTVRDFFERNHNGRVPNLTVQQLYTQFMTQETDCTGISYGLFNGVIKKLRFETGDSLVPGPGQSTVARPTAEAQAETELSDDPEIFEIGAMDFPDFKKFLTGSVFDKLMSDHDEEGGVFAGTANIVIGESGVGKSTITLDLLAKIKQQQPDAKVLYISSEMTRNDLYFYYRKMPIIETIPTLLIMDYLMGRFDKTLEKAINGDYDVILIDSHQDIIVKLKDVLGWKSTKAETWLTNLIIEAADKKGKAIFAIQHMTKGGQYVGSTYLKHATTSMMEIRKDEAGRRYAEFTKNRRGGSLVGKRLYYSLVDGEVKWDENAWRQENVVADLSEQESERRQRLEGEFNSLFLSVKRPSADETPTETEVD
jgi:archaellum biogenesis ATPase FlaH